MNRCDAPRRGPLVGLRVVEIASLVPGSFAGMLLADLGADVIRIDRAERTEHGAQPRVAALGRDILGRGRRSLALDLKHAAGVDLAMAIASRADVLVEGFRPGVMERLGLGPERCLENNPRLIYGRLTGWGQDGPYAQRGGHDIDYLALTGLLDLLGTPEKPTAPANLLGDFAGGGMLLTLGVLAALFERERSGLGQVVDASMVDGAALVGTYMFGMLEDGMWTNARGVNLLDGGAPFYDTYETRDGKHVAIGAIEPQFYVELVGRMGLDLDPSTQLDRSTWPHMRHVFQEAFRSKTRAQWRELLEAHDTCFAPVLSPREVGLHPQNRARATFGEVDGYLQPMPAPRFSRTPPGLPMPPPPPETHGTAALEGWGVDDALIDAALDAGAMAPTKEGHDE